MRCRSARSGSSRAAPWWRATSTRSSPSAPGRWRSGSLHGERALHAGGPVPVDRAVELVLAGLEGHGRRGAPARDHLRLLLDAVALDRDGVRDRGGVRERDLDLAGLRGRGGLVELQGAARGRGELEVLAAARRGRGRARRRARGAAAAAAGRVLVARAAARRDESEDEDGGEHDDGAHLGSPSQSRAVRTSVVAPGEWRTTRIASYSPRRAAVVSSTEARPCASARNVPALALQPGASQRTS